MLMLDKNINERFFHEDNVVILSMYFANILIYLIKK